MNCDFKSFQNYYLDNVAPDFIKKVETDFSNKMSIEDILGKTLGNSFAYAFDLLEHYHNWLTENFEIIPKN